VNRICLPKKSIFGTHWYLDLPFNPRNKNFEARHSQDIDHPNPGTNDAVARTQREA